MLVDAIAVVCLILFVPYAPDSSYQKSKGSIMRFSDCRIYTCGKDERGIQDHSPVAYLAGKVQQGMECFYIGLSKNFSCSGTAQFDVHFSAEAWRPTAF